MASFIYVFVFLIQFGYRLSVASIIPLISSVNQKLFQKIFR